MSKDKSNLEALQPSATTSSWLLWLGLSVTIIWVVLGLAYIFGSLGWTEFRGLSPDELGSFLEGSFAPLAFLWLVIGYFLQREELRQNTTALRAQSKEIQLSVEQLMIQSDKMAQTEIHSRQQTFLKIAERVFAQLGAISGLLYVSSHGVTEEGKLSQSEVGELFRQLSKKDTEVFSRKLLEAHFLLPEGRERYELFYGTEIRARHTNNFIFTFEKILNRASEVDPDNMIRESVTVSSHAFIYNIAKRFQAEAPPELADYKITGNSVNF